MHENDTRADLLKIADFYGVKPAPLCVYLVEYSVLAIGVALAVEFGSTEYYLTRAGRIEAKYITEKVADGGAQKDAKIGTVDVKHRYQWGTSGVYCTRKRTNLGSIQGGLRTVWDAVERVRPDFAEGNTHRSGRDFVSRLYAELFLDEPVPAWACRRPAHASQLWQQIKEPFKYAMGYFKRTSSAASAEPEVTTRAMMIRPPDAADAAEQEEEEEVDPAVAFNRFRRMLNGCAELGLLRHYLSPRSCFNLSTRKPLDELDRIEVRSHLHYEFFSSFLPSHSLSGISRLLNAPDPAVIRMINDNDLTLDLFEWEHWYEGLQDLEREKRATFEAAAAAGKLEHLTATHMYLYFGNAPWPDSPPQRTATDDELVSTLRDLIKTLMVMHVMGKVTSLQEMYLRPMLAQTIHTTVAEQHGVLQMLLKRQTGIAHDFDRLELFNVYNQARLWVLFNGTITADDLFDPTLVDRIIADYPTLPPRDRGTRPYDIMNPQACWEPDEPTAEERKAMAGPPKVVLELGAPLKPILGKPPGHIQARITAFSIIDFHVEYEVEVVRQLGDGFDGDEEPQPENVKTMRRFSEFVGLDGLLKAEGTGVEGFKGRLPRRTLRRRLDWEHINSRKQGLDAYLSQMLDMSGGATHPAVLAFLGLSQGPAATVAPALPAAGAAAGADAPAAPSATAAAALGDDDGSTAEEQGFTTVEILKWEVKGNHVEYLVRTTKGTVVVEAWRRYSDFFELNKQAKGKGPGSVKAGAILPPRTVFGMTALESYLKAVVARDNASSLVEEFLGLGPSTISGKAGASSAGLEPAAVAY